MSVSITVNDRVLVSGAFDGSLGKSGAVTRDELREVVREEVRAVFNDALRASILAAMREAQAPVTY